MLWIIARKELLETLRAGRFRTAAAVVIARLRAPSALRRGSRRVPPAHSTCDERRHRYQPTVGSDLPGRRRSLVARPRVRVLVAFHVLGSAAAAAGGADTCRVDGCGVVARRGCHAPGVGAVMHRRLLRHDWRTLRADFAVWAIAAVFGAALAYGFYNGGSWAGGLRRAVDAARHEERTRRCTTANGGTSSCRSSFKERA
jgi:hypothetical protein